MRGGDQRHVDPASGETFVYQSLGNALAQNERRARDDYATRVRGDEWYRAPGGLPGKFAAGVATLAGAVGGTMTDPTNLIGLGGRTFVQKAIGEGVVNAASDAGAQGLDLAGDVRDTYDPMQTALSGALGSGIGAAAHGAPIAGQFAVSQGRRALTGGRRVAANVSDRLNPVPSFGGQGMDSGAVRSRDVMPSGQSVADWLRNPVIDVVPEQRRAPRAAAAVNVPPAFRQSIGRASAETGVSESYLSRLAQRESGFDPTADAATSTARGLYQFTEGTWLDTLDRHAAALGLSNLRGRSRADLLALRDNPDLAIRAAALHSRDNATALRNVLGRDPTDGELYSAHFLGEGGARTLARADADARAADLFPDAAAANRSIFYTGNRPRTVVELRAQLAEGFGGSVTSPGASLSSFSAPLSREPSPFVSDTLTRRPLSDDALGIDAPAGRQAEPVRSATFDRALAAQGDEAPRFRAEDTPDGFRVFQEGRLRDVPMMWGRREGNDLRLENTALPLEMQGRGYGVEIYTRAADAAAERGGRLLSDSIVRPEAANVYEALARRGYTVARDPDARLVSGAWEAPDGRPVFTVAKASDLAAQPLAGVEGMAPARLAAGAGGKPRLATSAHRRVSGPSGRSPAPAAPPAKGTGQPLLATSAHRRVAASGKLDIDMSGYADRLGAGPATRPATQMRGQRLSTGQGAPDYAGQTVSTLAEKVRTSLGLTHRQGRVSSSRAAGEYDTKSGVIRTRAARHAMSVLSHEGGHALEYKRTAALAAALKAHEAELKPMAYEGAAPGVLREEGFAEFFRLYLTNPALARKDAPRFYDAFEAALQKDMPETAADLLGIQKGYGDLLAANSLDVAASSVAYTGTPGVLGAVHRAVTESGLSGSLLKLADEVYRGVYDTNHPFNMWVRELQKRSKANTGSRQNIVPADHPYVLARIANHSGNIAQSDIMHGVAPHGGADPEGPSLSDADRVAFNGKDPTPEQDARFAGYLIARRMVQEWDRYSRGELDRTPDKPEHDKAFHERVIADAERLNPTWREASDMANEWGRNLWKLKYDKGLLTREMYEAANANRTYHVPFQRDVSDLSKPGGRGRAAGVGQFAGGAKGFEGSERDIIHPLVSMVKDAFETRAVIARNETVSAMRRAMEKAGPNVGDLLEELPADQTHAIEVGALDAMKAAVKALGLDDRDTAISSIFQAMEAEKNIKATLFQSGPFTPRKNEAVVFEWRDGKATPYLLPDGWLGKKLFEAIGSMTGDTRTVWEEVAGAAAQALRLGITGVPEFAIKTTLRDQLAAAILTDVGFVPFVDTARGLSDAVTGSQNMRRYQAAGGLMGGETMAATRRAFPKNDVEAKRQLKRLRTRVVSSPADLMKGIAHLVDVGDTATRLSVFRKELERQVKNGESPARAVIAARHMSANFFDPSRIGGWAGVRQLARSVPFFNSGLQGPDIAVRVIRHAFSKPETMRDKAAFRQAVWALSMLGATAMLGLGVWAANHDDPDFQNINNQTRGTHWPLMKTGDGEWLLYPKSFELGMPSNLTERLAQALTEGDAKVFDRIRADVLNTMAPTRDAPILAVPFQAAANQDRNGTPIIPDHLRTGVEPDLQVNAWTSDTAKLLAGNAMSPAILEHYITGFFGSAGRDALKLGEMAIEAATGQPSMAGRAPDMMLTRGFVRRTARGSDSERTFWDLAARDGQLERAYRSYSAYLRDGNTARADRYLAGLSPQERSYVGAMAALEGESRMAHPLFRAREAVGVIGDIRRENREGVLLGRDGRLAQMTPQVRRAIDDGLDDLALAEIHNALIATGARGWETRDRIDAGAIFARIAEDDPLVAAVLMARWNEAKVPPAPAAEQVWLQLRPAFEGVTSEQLSPAMQARRLQGSGKNDEIRRRVAEMQQPPRRGLLGSQPPRTGLLAPQ
ncbi:LPD38 domain-containing protein [Brevundimonas sp.]|uniref:LPD38 domain-containing protein n=1 Tax=Brevundimonas sp. TaxID=1871086 RepID=UPI002D5A3059|nr:LPD38 domain-containing protein [Brevundimonas sp.]HYC98495.1 LPD38 domain-containing protein [Brevundimonas sp.]